MNTTPDKRDFSRLSEVTIAEAPSFGERLLPYLFAAMETCWIDAILIGLASLGSLAGNPIVPLWSPFVFIAGLCWLTLSRERQGHHVVATTSTLDSANVAKPSASIVFTGIVLLCAVLLTLWSSVYAASISLFNPLWVAAILNDLLLLNGNAFHIILVLLLVAYFGWRGVQLSRSALEPGSVSKTLRVGLFILLAVILLRALNGSHANELALLLLVPLFLAFVLVAHSLAQATLLRRTHRGGLQGSVNAQENSLLAIVTVFGIALLLVSLFIGAVASPGFFTQIQMLFAPVAIAYDGIAHVIAYIATLLLAPLLLLLQALHVHTSLPTINQRKLPPGAITKADPNASTNDLLVASFAHIIEIALPLLLLLVVILTFRLILRRRRIRLTRNQEDLHESLWAWNLFWTQLRAFLKSLFSRFFPTHSSSKQQSVAEELTGEPSARSIREIYRALLRWSAAHGIARKRAETPYEFRARLEKHLPLTEPELSVVTEAYTATRYGRAMPNEGDVARVQEAWMRLQQRQFPS